ncbi:MAG: hypothetical protein E7534_01275 [Ruminococcaceae bacterium]|nr:hypothetical protein [Oscillospiraceae bacterium]MBQ2780905.1 hypothetical protein [Clostridia bacterium]MBQ7303192.1 hypothetical protein [Clostridia bacterium]
MDIFVEQIVRKKKEGKDIAITVLVWLAVLIVGSAAVFFLLPLLGPLVPLAILAGGGYGAWWISTNRNREYEYCITNGSIDVDEIIAQRKRKRLVSVNGEKIETAGKFDAQIAAKPFDRTVIAAPSLYEEELWFFTYRSKKNGHTLVVFTPNERVLSAFNAALPRLLQLELSRKYDIPQQERRSHGGNAE